MTTTTKPLSKLLAEDLMQRDVITLSLTTGMAEALALFEENHISGAPVLDEHTGRVIGVFSVADLVRGDRIREERRPLRWFRRDRVSESLEWVEGIQADDLANATSIAECMTKAVISIGPKASIQAVARTFVDEGVHRVLVVEGQRLLGIVTTTDLARAVSKAQF